MARTKKTRTQQEQEEQRVDEASRESFPASDPPAFNPIIRQGPPMRRKKTGRK